MDGLGRVMPHSKTKTQREKKKYVQLCVCVGREVQGSGEGLNCWPCHSNTQCKKGKCNRCDNYKYKAWLISFTLLA